MAAELQTRLLVDEQVERMRIAGFSDERIRGHLEMRHEASDDARAKSKPDGKGWFRKETPSLLGSDILFLCGENLD